MKKYKLLYFVSEDEYFITHKIDQAKSALKIFREIKSFAIFQNTKIKLSHLDLKFKILNSIEDQ